MACSAGCSPRKRKSFRGKPSPCRPSRQLIRHTRRGHGNQSCPRMRLLVCPRSRRPPAPNRSHPHKPAAPERAPDARAQYLADLDNVRLMLRDYRSLMGDNPVGSNAEIMKSIMGGNPKRAQLGPPAGRGSMAAASWSTGGARPIFSIRCPRPRWRFVPPVPTRSCGLRMMSCSGEVPMAQTGITSKCHADVPKGHSEGRFIRGTIICWTYGSTFVEMDPNVFRESSPFLTPLI